MDDGEISTTNKVVAGVIILELSIFVSASLIKNTIVMIYEMPAIPINRGDSDFLFLLQQPLKDMLDMLIFLGLLSLFYYQSRQRQSRDTF